MKGLLIAVGATLALFGMSYVLTTDNTWLAGGLLGGGVLLTLLGARSMGPSP